MKRSLRTSLGSSIVAATLTIPSVAVAQEPAPAAPAAAPAPVAAEPSTQLTEVRMPKKPKRQPWVIFDPLESRWGMELSAGPTWWRPATGHVGESKQGLELSIMQTQTTYKEWGFVGGRAEIAFHALDSKSYAVTLPRYTYVAGLRLGPFEPEVGVSLAVLTVDSIKSDFSVGFFSPGARMGLYMNVWLLRVGAALTTEYRWRWLGDDNYRFQSLLFSINLGKMPPEQ